MRSSERIFRNWTAAPTQVVRQEISPELAIYDFGRI